MSQAHGQGHHGSAPGGGSLKIRHQLREEIHPLDKLADVASPALFDGEVVADLPTHGDKIFTVISDKLEEVLARKLAATFLIISKRICMKHLEMSTRFNINGYSFVE
jgi:hypothetical protein